MTRWSLVTREGSALAAARAVYFWPTMRVDTDAYVDRCVKCAQHKGTVSRPSPILEYPPPDRPWDVTVVSTIDLLQLPASHQGSRYLLLCVDHLSFPVSQGNGLLPATGSRVNVT